MLPDEDFAGPDIDVDDDGAGMAPVRFVFTALTEADEALERSIARDNDFTEVLDSSLSAETNANQ